MAVYTFKKRKDGKEIHIFQGEMTSTYQCSVPTLSHCKKMNQSDGDQVENGCQSESDARYTAAKLGRQVCGTCVSHLYTDY